MSDQPKTRRGPGRLIIIGAPVGVWVAITGAADGPVAEAGAIGGGIAAAALVLPLVTRGKGGGLSRAAKKATKKTTETSKDGESR